LVPDEVLLEPRSWIFFELLLLDPGEVVFGFEYLYDGLRVFPMFVVRAGALLFVDLEAMDLEVREEELLVVVGLDVWGADLVARDREV
jgi:hypothetical protein